MPPARFLFCLPESSSRSRNMPLRVTTAGASSQRLVARPNAVLPHLHQGIPSSFADLGLPRSPDKQGICPVEWVTVTLHRP